MALILLLAVSLGSPSASRPVLSESTAAAGEGELQAGLGGEDPARERYFRLVDEEGKTLAVTGRVLRRGDRFLSQENNLYTVYQVEGKLARARLQRKVQIRIPPAPLLAAASSRSLPAPAAAAALPAGGGRAAERLQAAQGPPYYRIAIYHSHNAESYLPSDGTDSVYGRGGIHQVGVSFKEALEEKGITALHSQRLHLPHDRGAYRRSRTTARELLAQRPDAIFDVHRDAAPWEEYALELENGEWITQISLVVGRSNPNYAVNQKFAFDLKGYADRLHPGLIRGVFILWGSYNQDLSPLSLLMEVGAHTNAREHACKGISLMADVVAYYFYGPNFLPGGRIDRDREPGDPRPPALYRDAGGISSAISGTVMGLFLTALGASLAFYFLNNPGSLEALFRWWESLPERWPLWVARIKQWFLGLPARLREAARASPANIREGWFSLLEDFRAFPGWWRRRWGRAREALLRLLAAYRRWREGLPDRWHQSWTTLQEEGRRLPERLALLGRRLPVWWRRGAAAGRQWWNEIPENWRLSWRQLLEELREWALFLQERVDRLLSRRRI